MKLYVVQKGDTFEEIARKHGMTIDEFRKMNTGLTEDSLAQGMKVKVAIGKQPLKRTIAASERSEVSHQQQPAPPQPQPKPKQQPVQSQPQPKPAPVKQEPISQQPAVETPAPKPVPPKPNVKIEAAEKHLNANIGSQNAGEAATDYPQILYPKQPVSAAQNPTRISPASQGNMGSAVSPATQGGISPYYPNMGNVVSPYTLGSNPYPTGNMGNVVSPVSQGSINPYYPNTGSAVSPATQESGATPYYPNMGSVVSPAMQGSGATPYYPNVGSVVSPATQEGGAAPYYPNMGNEVSPATQGNGANPKYPDMGSAVSPAMQGSGVAPYYPNMGNEVSPAQESGANPKYPDMGSAVSPAAQGSGANQKYPNMGSAVSPATQESAANSLYPTEIAGAYTPKLKPMHPYHPTGQMGQMSPYFPQLQPWKGQQPQYPISHETIELDQAYKDGKTAGIKSTLPWSNPQTAGVSQQAPPKFKPTQSSPTMNKSNTGKISPAGPGSIGGYPYPYMPAAKQQGKPCGCGGPMPYSPYGQTPVAGYYGGNKPPHPQPVPYSAMPGVLAPIYQPNISGQPKK
ncbi:LysM peptidoglycan-binding domain-containing protein [Sporolactobacillus laevolacticus]|uniref:LysM domain-containing protein n=1 Tax=Sporolactobacillus laevolacticus DSM 442 TaxID=1395513 RepID=V6J1L0_9BACL|nr:LysM domain-containing protein [Sporolactobacillus laevolacticus]EST13680.1 hypothetical protein P343_01275 [Sporolactobacillus laevolacticus DSM 442]